MTTCLLHGDTHRQMPQRSTSTLFCIVCLQDRPRKGGKHEGPTFKCAECRESLAKAEGAK
jgi:hypothetical protein